MKKFLITFIVIIPFATFAAASLERAEIWKATGVNTDNAEDIRKAFEDVKGVDSAYIALQTEDKANITLKPEADQTIDPKDVVAVASKLGISATKAPPAKEMMKAPVTPQTPTGR